MLPSLLIAIALFAGFLLVLGLIAFAAFRLSARREGPALGAAGGCALAAVLLGAAFFALIGFAIVTSVVVVQRAVKSAPFDHLRVYSTENDEGESGVKLSVDLRGRFAEKADQENVRDLLSEFDIEPQSIEVQRWQEGDRPRARVQITFPFEFRRRHDADAIEQRLRQAFEEPEEEEAREADEAEALPEPQEPEQPLPPRLPEGVREY